MVNDKDHLKLISRRERTSEVWHDVENGFVFKHAPKYLIDNEYHWLHRLSHTGYVPYPVKRVGDEVIRMPYIANEAVTDVVEFMMHHERVLYELKEAGCRHGDLTEYSVLVVDNSPILIDFGESRVYDSPLPDKRREGDRYWLERTMRRLSRG